MPLKIARKNRAGIRRFAFLTLWAAAAAILLAANGCGGGGGGGTVTPPGSRAKWTFLVYLDGANNLQQFGPLNFNQMEQVGSNADVNIVVQWKQATCYDCGTPGWVGTRRYLVTKNNDITKNGGNGTDAVGSTLVQDLGTGVDAGDWHTLHDFVAWGEQNFPADHYAVVLWDHGAGWYPIAGYRSANRAAVKKRALLFDDATKDEVEVWQLSQALTQAQKPDVVILDCSLMQMMETAYEVRNVTSVVVGSEESPPGYGYPYQLFLADLQANAAMTPAQFGSDIVDQTASYYTSNPALNPNNDNTQSAVDTSKLGALGTSVNTFANSLLSHATDSAVQLAAARNNAEPYDPNAGYGDFKDLYDYADNVKNTVAPADLKTAAAGVQQAFLNAVIDNKQLPGHPRSHGLSIYVPDPASYLPAYSNLALAKDTKWSQWLQGQKQ